MFRQHDRDVATENKREKKEEKKKPKMKTNFNIILFTNETDAKNILINPLNYLLF